MEEAISEEKKKWIEELSEVIGRADSFLKEACEYYQWDVKELEKVAEENYIVCPFDKSHVVPERSIQRHLELCEWRTLGYTKDCKPLPESAIPAESPFTIKFDMELQHKILQKAKQEDPQLDIGKIFLDLINPQAIMKPDFRYTKAVVYSRKPCVLFATRNPTDEKLIPQTSDRLTSDFTRDERIAMYDYVVANTLAPDLGQDITDMNKKEKKEERSASLLELLAQERNLKRRKTRYRGVHTNKKSHIEIMREVVQQQMEMFKEYLVEKCGISIPDEEEEASLNNFKDEKHSSSRSEFSSSNHKSRDESLDSHRSRDYGKNYRENSRYHSSDSHRSHSRDYNDRSRENYKYHSRDYNKSSSQHDDRDYKSYSKDSSSRRDYHDRGENDYKSRDRYEDKNYSRKHSSTKQYTNKSQSSNDCDKSYNKEKHDNQYDSKSRKRDRSSSTDRKHDSKSKDDSSSHNDKKHENGHKKKKHKSDRDKEGKKHKKSKHKHKSRSRSRS